MELENADKNRKVIPRLRDFKTTLVLGELHSTLPSAVNAIPLEASIDDELEDWENNRTLSFAADVVGSGFVLNQTDKIQEAAEFILSDEVQATELQKRIARQVKDPYYGTHLSRTEETLPDSSDLMIEHSQRQVNKYRHQLSQSPRNPIIFVELAREFATLGSIKKALRAMDTAVALAPANRFVLRSAARLYIHANEVDKAHFILRRAPSLRFDPWLLAAEIAVASLRDQTSRHINTGLKQIADANNNPFDISELASAIATLEMENAKSKVARKLFRQALYRPTDNSIAQVEWASHSITSLQIDIPGFDVPRKFEALASDFYQKGQWDMAIAQGKSWILDQPFAVTPVLFTGVTASNIEDFDLSERVYKFGLRANPTHVVLRNNLAFVLASKSMPEAAEKEFTLINRSDLPLNERIVTTATEGLIKFRSGVYKEGRRLYREAIKIANENNEPGYALKALAYLAREEMIANTELAVRTHEMLEKEVKRFHTNQEIKLLLNKLNSLRNSSNLRLNN